MGARLCLGHMDTGNYDAETVRFFDVAHEGAQIRLVAGEVERWGEALSGLNPRSLVIIPTDAIARQAAHLGVGLAEPLRIPIVVTESLPRYVGALDLVVVVGKQGATSVSSGQSSTSGPLAGPMRTVVAPRWLAVMRARDAQSHSPGSPTTTTRSSAPT